MRQRPESFTLDYSHSLAKHLVLAGLGLCPGTLLYMDSSVNKNHGTLTNMDPSPDWVWDSMLNRFALDFNGNNQIVGFPQLAAHWSRPSVHKTLAAWFRVDEAADNKVILGSANYYAVKIRKDGYCIVIASDGTVHLVAGNNSIDVWTNVYGSFTPATWTHVATTVTGEGASETATMYINGAVAATWVGTIGSYQNYFSIGGTDKHDGEYSFELVGKVADPIVSSSIYSLSEIQQLADPSNVMLSGLIKPPKRKLYAVRSTAYSQRFFSLQTSFGAFALQS